MNILHALETHAVFGGSQQLYFGTNVGSYHLELMGGSFKIILFKYRPRSWCVYIVHDCAIPLTIAFRTATRKGHLVEAASGSNSLQKHAAVKFHFAPQPTVEVTIMHPRKIIYHHLRSTAFSRLHQHETSSQFRIIYICEYICHKWINIDVLRRLNHPHPAIFRIISPQPCVHFAMTGLLQHAPLLRRPMPGRRCTQRLRPRPWWPRRPRWRPRWHRRARRCVWARRLGVTRRRGCWSHGCSALEIKRIKWAVCLMMV